jgi:hypothetical protein
VTTMIATRSSGPTTSGPAQCDPRRPLLLPRHHRLLRAIGTDRPIAEPLATVRAERPTLRATETTTTISWLGTDNTSTRRSGLR